SRRRHTRSKRDWSSDVCSSDLCTVSPPKSAQNTAPSWRWNPLASAAFPYKQLLSTVPAGTLSALLTLGRPVGTPAAPGAVAAAAFAPADGPSREIHSRRQQGQQQRGKNC